MNNRPLILLRRTVNELGGWGVTFADDNDVMALKEANYSISLVEIYQHQRLSLQDICVRGPEGERVITKATPGADWYNVGLNHHEDRITGYFVPDNITVYYRYIPETVLAINFDDYRQRDYFLSHSATIYNPNGPLSYCDGAGLEIEVAIINDNDAEY